MSKIKLFKYLGDFSSVELNAFDNYLQKNYAEKQIAIRAFQAIKRFHPRYHSLNEKEFESVYVRTFGNPIRADSEENYKKDRKNLHNTFSDLTLLLQEFLAFREFKKNKSFQDFMLIKALRSRPKLSDEYEKSLRKFSGDYEKNPSISPPEDQIWELSLFHDHYFSDQTDQVDDQAILVKCNDLLDEIYAVSKLKYVCEFVNRNKVLNETNEIPLLDEIIENFSKGEYLSELHELYYHALLILKNDNVASYRKLKNSLICSSLTLPILDHNILTTILLNYASAQIKSLDESYVQEAFELYKFDLEVRYPIKKELLTQTRIMNIIDVACGHKKFEWAKETLRTWSRRIAGTREKNIIAYLKARIAFEDRQYSETIRFLTKKRFANIFIALRAKAMIFCSYFVLYRHDFARVDKIDNYGKAFTKYVNRKKNISKINRESIFNLIRFITEIINEKEDTEEIILKYENDLILLKPWLMEELKR